MKHISFWQPETWRSEIWRSEMIKSPYLVHGTRMSLTWQVLLIAFLGVQELQTSRIDIDLINFLIQTQIAKGK